MRGVMHTKDVAVLFGVSEGTVRRRARRGDFAARKVERRWVFNPKELVITWNTVIASREPSPTPARDVRELFKLMDDLNNGRVFPVEIEETQRRVLDLVLGILPTEFRVLAWNLIEGLRGNPLFAFLMLVPDRVPIH